MVQVHEALPDAEIPLATVLYWLVVPFSRATITTEVPEGMVPLTLTEPEMVELPTAGGEVWPVVLFWRTVNVPMVADLKGEVWGFDEADAEGFEVAAGVSELTGKDSTVCLVVEIPGLGEPAGKGAAL